MTTTAPQLECPACHESMGLDHDPFVGEVIVCGSCSDEIEVISVDPVTLERFEEEEK